MLTEELLREAWCQALAEMNGEDAVLAPLDPTIPLDMQLIMPSIGVLVRVLREKGVATTPLQVARVLETLARRGVVRLELPQEIAAAHLLTPEERATATTVVSEKWLEWCRTQLHKKARSVPA